MKKILITGCSSGFGYLSALKFAKEGWEVFASVKDIQLEGAVKLKSENLENLKVIEIDVTDNEQINSAVSNIEDKYGPINVLVNNAGFGYTGPVEAFSIEEVNQQFDVNYNGALRMIKAVVPGMRRANKGRIINISSVNGLLSFGLMGIYSASKFALETTSEVLDFELSRFNIRVCLIEPGAFRTEFNTNEKHPEPHNDIGLIYSDLISPLKDRDDLNPVIKWLTDPEHVVNKIYEAASVRNPKLRYKVGLDTHLYTFGRKILPYSIWKNLLRKIYKW